MYVIASPKLLNVECTRINIRAAWEEKAKVGEHY